jgi:hypothetical protein
MTKDLDLIRKASTNYFFPTITCARVKLKLYCKQIWSYDTQHNDNQNKDTQDDYINHNDTQHNDVQHNGIQRNNK